LVGRFIEGAATAAAAGPAAVTAVEFFGSAAGVFMSVLLLAVSGRLSRQPASTACGPE
jgi:hypothetical protein